MAFFYQKDCHCPEAYTRPLQISVKVVSANSTEIQGQTFTQEIVTLAMYKDVNKETSTTITAKDGNDDSLSSSSTNDGSGFRNRRRTLAVAAMSVTMKDEIYAPMKEKQSVFPPSSTPIPTIQNLFDMIQEPIDAYAEDIHVQYDADYGYPISVHIDYSSAIANDDTSFTATITTKEEKDPTLSEFYMNGKINLYDLATTLNSLPEITPLTLQEALRRTTDDDDDCSKAQLIRRTIQDKSFVEALETTHFYQHYSEFDKDGFNKVDMYQLTLELIQLRISTSISNIKLLHKMMNDTPLVK